MASLRSACGAPPRRRSNRDDARERGRVYPTIARGHGAGRLRSRFAVHANGDELKTCRECTPGIPSEPLNVIGIDDWAWRRNHRYGTIVCDLERRQPVGGPRTGHGASLARWASQSRCRCERSRRWYGGGGLRRRFAVADRGNRRGHPSYDPAAEAPHAAYAAKRCRACSLLEICAPRTTADGGQVAHWLERMIGEWHVVDRRHLNTLYVSPPRAPMCARQGWREITPASPDAPSGSPMAMPPPFDFSLSSSD